MSSTLCDGGEVGSECFVELPGDVAFEAPDDCFLGSSFGESSSEDVNLFETGGS